MRIVALLSLAAALAQAPAPSEPPQPSRASPPVFPTGVELVAIDLSVVDEQGRPVRDLGPADFQVTVKGKQTHGSTPEKGINSFRAASHLVVELEKLYKFL